MSNDDLILTRVGQSGPRLLFVEPYLNTSHQALAQCLMQNHEARWSLLALPGRNFRWRMRGAASYLAFTAGDVFSQKWDGMICSSMLGLAELRGLVPSLATTPALVYFHENQLDYPAQGAAGPRQKRRDLYLAYSNLTSAQAARLVVFNSDYHQRLFLDAAHKLLAMMPDARPSGLVEDIAQKCRVLPVPLMVDEAAGLEREPRDGPLRLVWNHRWSQDKDPPGFCQALTSLVDQGLNFEVAILGPPDDAGGAAFAGLPETLGPRLVHLGPEANRRRYWSWLFWADIVVSTSRQEFLGLSVAEAVWAGCRPLVPDSLVYPELYPHECRYPTGGLPTALARLAADPQAARQIDYTAAAQALTWPAVETNWAQAIKELCEP